MRWGSVIKYQMGLTARVTHLIFKMFFYKAGHVYRKTLFALLFFFSFFNCSGQNLTGTWVGSGGGSNYCKLVVVHVNDSVFGFTYDEGMGYCKCNFAGKYNGSLKKLNGHNTSVIEKTLMHSMSRYQLTYSKEGDIEYLKGRAGAKSTGAQILSFGLMTPVSYTKVTDEIDTTAYIAARLRYYAEKADSVKPEQPALPVVTAVTDTTPAVTAAAPDLTAVKQSRQSALIKTIETKQDSVKLVLYDNGEIDGDTVTVFLNGNIIISSLGLTVKPFEKMIAVPANGSVQVIELMANNLGSIPPNTAYMQLWENNKLHELRVSSDFKTNARIEIKHKTD